MKLIKMVLHVELVVDDGDTELQPMLKHGYSFGPAPEEPKVQRVIRDNIDLVNRALPTQLRKQYNHSIVIEYKEENI